MTTATLVWAVVCALEFTAELQGIRGVCRGISVCMNTFNSVTIKARDTKFGRKTSVNLKLKMMHVNL